MARFHRCLAIMCGVSLAFSGMSTQGAGIVHAEEESFIEGVDEGAPNETAPGTQTVPDKDSVSGGDPVVADVQGDAIPDDIAVESSFDATEALIGQGLQIKIPADFNPTYYKDDGEFRCESEIVITGELAPNRRLKIETTPELLYKSESDDEIFVPGAVNFGKNGVEYWYTEEILNAGGELAKPIFIVIDRRDIIVPANYKTSVVFSFALEECSEDEGQTGTPESADAVDDENVEE